MIRVKSLESETPNQAPTTTYNNLPLAVPRPGNGDQLHITLLEQKALAASLGADAEIHGAGVWALFNGKPGTEVRAQLKANSWIWCRGKGKWAYRGKPCASKKAMTWEYITSKYPEEESS